MTGFVFTFSLFCTALLQTDPAVLQHVEFAPVRQIIDAVIPEARQSTYFHGRHKLVPPSTLHHTPSAQTVHAPSISGEGNSVPSIRLSRVFRARPIRAPAV